jgi:hypothetical protein
VTEAVGMQEWGNIDFVLDHGLGFFRPTPERIIQALEELRDPQLYADTVARLKGAVPRNGSTQIARILLEMVEDSQMTLPPDRKRRKVFSLRRRKKVEY